MSLANYFFFSWIQVFLWPFFWIFGSLSFAGAGASSGAILFTEQRLLHVALRFRLLTYVSFREFLSDFLVAVELRLSVDVTQTLARWTLA